MLGQKYREKLQGLRDRGNYEEPCKNPGKILEEPWRNLGGTLEEPWGNLGVTLEEF